MTPESLQFTKEQEGCRLEVYADQLGLATQGYGHRVANFDVPPISQEQADLWLQHDLAKAEMQALSLCPNLNAYPRRLAALTDLCFNAGVRTLQGKSVLDPADDDHVVQYLRQENWTMAAVYFKKYMHGHKNGVLIELPVLKHRRDICARWILEG